MLEDHAEPAPAQLAQPLLVGLADVVAVEEDLAGGRLDQAGDAAHERRLAAARQAHDHEDLARPDVERDVAQARSSSRSCVRSSSRGRSASGRADGLVLGRPEDLPQVPHREGRRAPFRRHGWVARSVAVALTSPLWSPLARGQPVTLRTTPSVPGAVFCQMCFASRYSSRPLGPSSRPMPDCLKPPHSAWGRYVL